MRCAPGGCAKHNARLKQQMLGQRGFGQRAMAHGPCEREGILRGMLAPAGKVLFSKPEKRIWQGPAVQHASRNKPAPPALQAIQNRSRAIASRAQAGHACYNNA